MAIKKKSKPTLKELMSICGKIMMHQDALRSEITNNARVVDEYIQYKEDKDGFIEYLKTKLEIDDKDKEKAEEE